MLHEPTIHSLGSHPPSRYHQLCSRTIEYGSSDVSADIAASVADPQDAGVVEVDRSPARTAADRFEGEWGAAAEDIFHGGLRFDRPHGTELRRVVTAVRRQRST